MMVTSQLCWLFVPFWFWRTTAWWRSRSSWKMAWDPGNVQRWKHKVGFHNRVVQWDAPMARWAGEGKRLDQSYGTTETSQRRRYSQLARSMKQVVGKKTASNVTRSSKTPRYLPLFELGIPAAGQCPTLEIKKTKNDSGLGERSRQDENEG